VRSEEAAINRRWILRAAIGYAALAAAWRTPAAADERYAAFVIEAFTGQVLHEEDADARRYPASLAKMMTLYLLFDAMRNNQIHLDDMLVVSAGAATQPPSRLGLEQGDRLTVEDAILGLAVWSANDVATVIAERLGGSEERFAGLMTARARQLGMPNTRFANASGLPDSRNATTARDMARLARALWTDFPEDYHYFQTANFTWDSVRVRNHNHLLGQLDGVDGVKTGYTRDSGFNIAASASRDGERVIAVVMGGRTAAYRDAQATYLIDAAFEDLADANGHVQTASGAGR
jgi:D-alanyl-D-alanine carboxypeptidase